jgi:hypothetical protein
MGCHRWRIDLMNPVKALPMQAQLIVLPFALIVCGCSIDPGATWAPDALKAQAPKAPALEAPPSMREMLQTRSGEFFLPSAGATNISFSTPRRAQLNWSVCLRATVNGAAGGSIGEQTFLVSIEHDRPVRQENVGPSHWCRFESYERLS